MSYAYLGQSCQTSMSVLIDNRKFFPLDDPIYDVFITKMQRYPATHDELNPISEEVQRPEDIKTSKNIKRQMEEYPGSCSSCGKK